MVDLKPYEFASFGVIPYIHKIVFTHIKIVYSIGVLLSLKYYDKQHEKVRLTSVRYFIFYFFFFLFSFFLLVKLLAELEIWSK